MPSTYSTVARQTGQDWRDALEARGWLAPTPRYLYGQLDGDELADLVVENYELRRAQMGPRIITDMRMLRYFDPEQIQDQWQNPWTGTPLKKLSRARGKAIDIFNWSGAVGESLVGLVAGHKPFAYAIDVEPEDPESDPAAARADGIEGWVYREQVRQKYPLTYMDGMGWTMVIGRHWKMVTTDPVSRQLKTQIVWPGHVAAFWQEDQRTLEQVIVQRQMTLGEAMAMYAPGDSNPILKSRLANAVGIKTDPYMVESTPAQRNATITLLTNFYREGDSQDGEQVSMATVVMGTAESEGAKARAVLVDDVRGMDGYEDIPLYCTPRFKIMDKPPDEAIGALNRIAGAQTWYNEVFSASRDMLNRTIYPRLKAKGFSFRNAPRFIERSAMYALPRENQDIARIEETLNTVPVEQTLTRLEDTIVVLGGLNKYFLGSAPPSETSGDAIDAALTATMGRHEPTRTEVAQGELWMYAQWLAQGERWTSYRVAGQEYPLKDLVLGQRDVVLYWADAIELGKVKRQQMSLAFRNAGLVSDDFSRDTIGVRSKIDEVRKIRKERKDPWLHPEHVSQAAAAMIQMAEAKAMEQSQGQPSTPQKRINISLAGPLSSEAAAELAGVTSVAPAAAASGGTAALPGRQNAEVKPGAAAQAGAKGAEAAKTAAARAAPPSFQSDNQPGGATAPPTQIGDLANPAGSTGPVRPAGG